MAAAPAGRRETASPHVSAERELRALRRARCTVTSEEEHAVSTLRHAHPAHSVTRPRQIPTSR
eukprot:8820689-Pyramimonas_sp.AAC.1